MNLYLIKARRDLPENDDPWRPWFDKAFGFVVRAESESEARRMAANGAGEEGHDAWLNAELSNCEILVPEGDPGVIIENFASA